MAIITTTWKKQKIKLLFTISNYTLQKNKKPRITTGFLLGFKFFCFLVYYPWVQKPFDFHKAVIAKDLNWILLVFQDWIYESFKSYSKPNMVIVMLEILMSLSFKFEQDTLIKLRLALKKEFRCSFFFRSRVISVNYISF